MTKIKNLLSEITRLTSEIESKHPELYRFLDENPITLPSAAHPEITQDVLTEYLVSLRQQLRHFLETHRKSILKT